MDFRGSVLSSELKGRQPGNRIKVYTSIRTNTFEIFSEAYKTRAEKRRFHLLRICIFSSSLLRWHVLSERKRILMLPCSQLWARLPPVRGRLELYRPVRLPSFLPTAAKESDASKREFYMRPWFPPAASATPSWQNSPDASGITRR